MRFSFFKRDQIQITLWEPFKQSYFVSEMLHKNRFELDLETCCIGDLCTLNRNGVPWPIIYGVGVNVKTGDIFPAQFNEKGPDMDLRYARTLTGGDNVGVSIFFKFINHIRDH